MHTFRIIVLSCVDGLIPDYVFLLYCTENCTLIKMAIQMAMGGVDTALSKLGNLSELIGQTKSLALMIRNMTDTVLCEPKVFTTSGKVFSAIPNRINPNGEVQLGFHKTPYGARGAEGVIVYKLAGSTQHLCIFYCVPLMGYNGFFLKWKNRSSVSASADLCEEMAPKQWDIAGEIGWHDVGTTRCKATGFMTQGDKACMIVEVSNVA